MNPFENNTRQATQIQQLERVLFVVHFWYPLSILGADGALFNLDTKILDVDGDNPVEIVGGVTSGGVGVLKRLRLLPISATQRPLVNNKEGFAATNVFQGAFDGAGRPSGIGSMMGVATKTNVRAEWSYPEQKLTDMIYTFGKNGLVGINCLAATGAEDYMRAQKIFNAVMAGIVDSGREQTLLEDMPEYFGEPVSLYLGKKPPARFKLKAHEIVERATDPDGCAINGRVVRLSPDEADVATRLIAELIPSVNQTHVAALDEEANGVLAETRKGLQNGQKRSIDKFDQWLMAQFPSFPMDTQLEKSQAQLIKAMQTPDAPPDGYVSRDEYELVLEENSRLRREQEDFQRSIEERFAKLEGKTPAGDEPAAT